MKCDIMKGIKSGAIFIVLIIGMLLMITETCQKESEPILIQGDTLTEWQLQILDEAGVDTVTTFQDALFPDSSNMSEWAAINDSGYVFVFNQCRSTAELHFKKLLFISRMTRSGFILSDKKHIYQNPYQHGLAWVNGSKYFNEPSIGEGKPTCKEPLYGLDCSGMIYQMATSSNLNLISGGTIQYADIKTWNIAFKNSPDFQGLEMIDKGPLEASSLKAGDVIVQSGVHMGMVGYHIVGHPLLFNSSGKNENTCDQNSNSIHGPVLTLKLEKWLKDFFTNHGHTYKVLRVNIYPILNTTWTFSFFYPHYNWHADVTFNEDGSTKYQEPDSTGGFLEFGTWSLDENKIHYVLDKQLEPDYVCDGLIVENTMSGTYVHNGQNYPWSAVKKTFYAK